MPPKKKQKTVPDKNQPTLVALLQKDRATEPSSETQDPQAGPQTQDTDAAESEKPSSIESNSDQSGSKKITTFHVSLRILSTLTVLDTHSFRPVAQEINLGH